MERAVGSGRSHSCWLCVSVIKEHSLQFLLFSLFLAFPLVSLDPTFLPPHPAFHIHHNLCQTSGYVDGHLIICIKDRGLATKGKKNKRKVIKAPAGI